MLQTNTRLRFGAGIFHIAIGVLFMIWGLRVDNLRLIVLLGVGLIGYGLYMFVLGAHASKM